MSYVNDVKNAVRNLNYGPFNASTVEIYRAKIRETTAVLLQTDATNITHSQEEVTRAVQQVMPDYQLSNTPEDRVRLSETARKAMEDTVFHAALDEYTTYVASRFGGRFAPLMGVYIDKCMNDQPHAKELRDKLVEMGKKEPVDMEQLQTMHHELRLAVASHLVEHADERGKLFENLISSEDLVEHYEEYHAMLALYGQLETEYYSGSLSDRPQEERDRVRSIIGPMSGYQWNLDVRMSLIGSDMGKYIDENQFNRLTPDQMTQLETALPGFQGTLSMYKGLTTMYETRITDPIHHRYQTVPGKDTLLYQNMDGDILSEKDAMQEFLRGGRPMFALAARRPDQLPILVYPADAYGKSRTNENIQKDLTPPPKPGGVALFFDAIIRHIPLLKLLRSDACKKWTDWNQISESLQEKKLADVRKNMIRKTYHTSVEEYQEQVKQAEAAKKEAAEKEAAKEAEERRKAAEKKAKEEARKQEIEAPRKAFLQNLEKSGLPAETQMLLRTLREEAMTVRERLGDEVGRRTRNEKAQAEAAQSATGPELLSLMGLDPDEDGYRITDYMARSIIGHSLVSLIDKETERLANLPEKSGVIEDERLNKLTKLPPAGDNPLTEAGKRNRIRKNLDGFSRELKGALADVPVTLADLKNICNPGRSIRGDQKRSELVLAANLKLSAKSQPEQPQPTEVLSAGKQAGAEQMQMNSNVI